MASIVNPGELRFQVAIEEPQATPDGAGGYVAGWLEIARVFARIEPLFARDEFGAAQTIEEVSHRITIRFREDVESGMRLRRGSRLFDILTVHDPDETGRYLVLRAKEQGR